MGIGNFELMSAVDKVTSQRWRNNFWSLYMIEKISYKFIVITNSWTNFELDFEMYD